MKKFCLVVALLGSPAASATAADMAARPYTKSPPAVAAVYNWTGVYIGGNVGYGWGQNTARSISFVDPGGAVGFGPYFATGNNVFPNLRPAGAIGGGQAGYNWQINALVVGAVVDSQAADIQASATGFVLPTPFNTPSAQSLSQQLDFLGTLRGRVGGAINNVMIYGTGGYAYGRVRSSLNLEAPTGPAFFAGSATEWRSGWAAGAGAEYGLGSWSLGVEYLHYDLGRSSLTALAVAPGPAYPGASLTADQRVAGDIVRATVSYRLGAPMVAKYP
jgi:outer membrane immunogenic protein